jgi:ABC-type polysaccharide/polyol phosphate export permease
MQEWRLLFRLVERDLRSKYVGSLLGIFWTVINPLLLLLVFTFIFAIVFKAKFGASGGIGLSALYILTGLIPWLGFQEGVVRSASYLIEHRNLVSRVKFPVKVLAGVPALSGFLGQMIGFLVLIVWAGVKGKISFPALALVPLWMALQLGLALGISYFLSALSVWVRDLIQLVPVLLLVWLYATPVFYPASLVPEKFQLVILLNPMAHLVEGYRMLLLEGGFPALGSSLYLSGSALLSLGIGFWTFSRLKKGFADRI